jgi:hypothetical protein
MIQIMACFGEKVEIVKVHANSGTAANSGNSQ